MPINSHVCIVSILINAYTHMHTYVPAMKCMYMYVHVQLPVYSCAEVHTCIICAGYMHLCYIICIDVAHYVAILLHIHVHVDVNTHTVLPPVDGDRSLGMVIVSGKVRNKDGGTVEGIFIQKILAGSLTDKDGR